METYAYNSIDSILILNTYTPKGEVETQERYETRNFANTGRYFGHIQSDSFSYHYDVNDRLILKEEYTKNYNNPIGKHFTTYEYYCNGQLKSETYNGEHPYCRKDYSYYGGVDCPLDEEEKKLLLFPNPTKGIVNIKSKLEADINEIEWMELIDANGRVVQKFGRKNPNDQIDIGHHAKGAYFLKIKTNIGLDTFRVLLLPE